MISRVDLRNYLVTLESKRRELAQALSSRDEIKIEGRAPDHLDEALASSARVIAVEGINRSMGLLKQVDHAIEKLHSDYLPFGECETCEEEIPSSRLKVVPWAKLCVNCQSEQEQKGNGN